MQVQPYLSFEGRCEEAFEFYRKAVGAKVTALMRFKDSPQPCPDLPKGCENKVMHGAIQIGSSTVMGSDCHSSGNPKFVGFSLSLSLPTDADAEKKFLALAEGGEVKMPLGKTFFASSFGVVVDRFGVSWMVIVMP